MKRVSDRKDETVVGIPLVVGITPIVVQFQLVTIGVQVEQPWLAIGRIVQDTICDTTLSLLYKEIGCIVCDIRIPQHLAPSIFIFYEVSTYTTLYEIVIAYILNVWILDSRAYNLDRTHIPLLPTTVYKIIHCCKTNKGQSSKWPKSIK